MCTLKMLQCWKPFFGTKLNHHSGPEKSVSPHPLYRNGPFTHWASQWLSSKESACNAEAAGHQVQSFLGWEDPLEEGTVTHPRILAW